MVSVDGLCDGQLRRKTPTQKQKERKKQTKNLTLQQKIVVRKLAYCKLGR